jgi:hypothetical protein
LKDYIVAKLAAISAISQGIFGNSNADSAEGSAGSAALLAMGLPPPRLPKSSFKFQATSRENGTFGSNFGNGRGGFVAKISTPYPNPHQHPSQAHSLIARSDNGREQYRRFYQQFSRYGEKMGYILEEHFVTLWQGWR